MVRNPILSIYQLILVLVIVIFSIYGLYFHYIDPLQQDFWPYRLGLVLLAGGILLFSFLNRIVRSQLPNFMILLSVLAVIQSHLNMLLYGMDYATYFRTTIISIGASFFFYRRLQFLIYVPFYIALGILTYQFSSHKDLSFGEFLFRQGTGLLIQAVFVVYVLSKEDRLKSIYRQKQNEISRAQETLFSLLPRDLKPLSGMRVAGFFAPSEELGGDFFDLRPCGKEFVILMADCSGHGISSSLNAVLLKTVCDRHFAALEKHRRPEEFLSRVNRDMEEYSHGSQYHALLIALIDGKRRELRYANAGAKTPVLIRKSTATKLPGPRGFLLGYERGIKYECARIPLQKGDRIFFHSDALTEIVSKKSGLSLFGDRHLEKVLADFTYVTPEADLPVLYRRAVKENGERPLRDDLTMVLAEISGGPAAPPAIHIEKMTVPKDGL